LDNRFFYLKQNFVLGIKLFTVFFLSKHKDSPLMTPRFLNVRDDGEDFMVYGMPGIVKCPTFPYTCMDAFLKI
ncbi:hypothetical protein, partial [Paenibacillus sp.]|uniref:hypothetical protein n=1 Tax=Paenibacillus sp. TaxID=58172 RepID=UPI0028A8A7F7